MEIKKGDFVKIDGPRTFIVYKDQKAFNPYISVMPFPSLTPEIDSPEIYPVEWLEVISKNEAIARAKLFAENKVKLASKRLAEAQALFEREQREAEAMLALLQKSS